MKKEEKLVNKIKRLLRRLKVPRYLHRFGPKTYEFYEHLQALLIKVFCKLSYRRIKQLLDSLGIRCPSKSALHYTTHRISSALWQKMLELTSGGMHYLIALDSTGFSRINPSYYYLRRINGAMPKIPVKLSCTFDTRKKKFCAAKIRVLPAHDIKDAESLIKKSKPEIVVADKGYDVFVEWPDESIRKKLINRFGFKLPESINFVKSINRGDCYDLCFWVSDGSIPTLRARKNFIHFQVPFQNVDGRSLLNKMKLFRVNEIICNSEFTKRIIDKEYGVSSKVLYPPIDIKLFKPRRKENQICYVGRFSNLVQNKGHENLIISFKKLVTNKKFKDWKLILAGGIEVGVGDYVTKLKKMSNKFNIEIIESPDFDKIKEIYGKSKFFWSAAGFAVDEIKNPENRQLEPKIYDHLGRCKSCYDKLNTKHYFNVLFI